MISNLIFGRCILQAYLTEKKGARSTLDEIDIAEQRLSLRRKIKRFREHQAVHMPSLAAHLDAGALEISQTDWETCEQLSLFLPSSLPLTTRSQVCSENLISTETDLRLAHLSEALDSLRLHLRTRVFANKFKIKNVTGQRSNTRSRQWQKTIDKKVLASKRRYRFARAALYNLRGSGDWEKLYRELKDEDVRAFNERALTLTEIEEREAARRAAGIYEEEVLAVPLEDGIQLGEGRRHLSWIWLTQGCFDPKENDHALQIGELLLFSFVYAA